MPSLKQHLYYLKPEDSSSVRTQRVSGIHEYAGAFGRTNNKGKPWLNYDHFMSGETARWADDRDPGFSLADVS